jgi:Tol biopolymer transport system component
MKKYLILIVLALIVQYSFGQQFTDLYGDYLGQTLPGDTPVVFAPGIISRYSLEHGPAVFSPDGNEVYWAWRDNPSTICHIWYMKRINNRWTKPEGFAPFGDTVTHWDPFLSLDGKRLYFSAENKGIPQIWFVEKQGNVWGKPQSISPVINDSKGQCQAVLNHSGTVYYSKAGIKGKIVRSKLKNGKYLPPDTLPSCINQASGDPHIAPDDSYLLFASRRLNDQLDIYISLHDTLADTWSEPINLGEPINKNLPSYLGIDRFPAISPDGKYLFFTRYNGYGNDMDVFWVSAKIIDRLREKMKK